MLKEILKNKEKEVEILRKEFGQNTTDKLIMKEKQKGFLKNIIKKVTEEEVAVIAEIKRHSPSKGYLDKNLDLKLVAEQYERAGAACISVLTDRDYFKGSIEDLIYVKKHTTLPILRKDFIIDESQIIESKIIGADCILLIVAALNKEKFKNLYELSLEFGLDVLVEVHDKSELDVALENNCKLIGINNRDLKTFDVSIQTSIDLCNLVEDKNILLVSESGIMNKKDINILKEFGIKAFLIGEKLITSVDREKELQELIK
ncbi:MAG: indole-3-glycerol phosphate synthase TrpC [Pseudomonadota bacterium]|nr:indole-3-glycerol phosphate synthase TrpC [Pseudomonadota bacterium]